MRAMKTVRAIATACQNLLAKGWRVQKRNNGKIRFRPPNYGQFCDCPITAAHRDRFGTQPPKTDAGEYEKAARELHIHCRTRDIVVDAADKRLDMCTWEDSEAARLLFLRKLNLPLDVASSSDLALVSEKGQKLFQAEIDRRKKKKHL